MLAVIFPMLVFFVVLAFVGLFAIKKLGTREVSVGDWPLYAKAPLNGPEQILYQRLIEAFPDHVILSQVQLSRVLGVKQGFNFNEWNNRIRRLSYDFVICLKDASVVAAIELDGKTAEHAARSAADRTKEKAAASAGIKLVRWKIAALPDAAAIRHEIGQGSPNPPGG
jgi:NOL1/NOP2/fmu family ribosome biogenesis protein